MIRRIKSVYTRPREYKFDNLKSATKFPLNLRVGKTLVFDGYGSRDLYFTIDNPNGLSAIYNTETKGYLQYVDGSLYRIISGTDVYVGNVGGGKLQFVDVLINGETKTLVCGGSSPLIIDEDKAVDLPKSTATIFHKGRYFFAAEEGVFYTGLFNFEKNSANLEMAGKVWFDENSGIVCGFCADQDKLFVLCQKAIYKITPFVEGVDFKVEKIETPYLDILVDTFASSNKSAMFISNQTLYKFENEKLTKIDTFLNYLTFEPMGRNEIYKEKFYMPIVLDDDRNCVYIYDFSTGDESLMHYDDGVEFNGRRYVANNRIYEISENTKPRSPRELSFVPIDFFNVKQKTLTEINLKAGGDAVIEINGDFGRKTYDIIKGNNSIIVNLKSHAFNFKITASDSLTIKNVSLKYRLKGE